MQSHSLTGQWQFRRVGTDDWYPATVPGGVHTDLLALEMIPDPFVGDQELDVMWVAEKDWVYQCTFIPDVQVLAEDKIFLVADGLDTLAKVSLNGNVLGNTNNQFRQWCWDVKELLSEEENTLEILFSGPANYVAQEQKRRRMKGVGEAIEGAPHLRKAPCQFGWDWGPKLPSIGIWKDIRLEGRSIARIKDVYLRQRHEDNAVTVEAEVSVEKWEEQDVSAVLEIISPNGQETFRTEAKIIDNGNTLEAEIADPQLWWPNGLGEQNLYDISVILISNGIPLEKKEYKFGLRTIELLQEDDEFGKSFQFVVNGVPIFAKGSNWIPADAFINRFSDERLEKLVADAAAGHQNMLRVWGGGFYEQERFYDLCDKYGLLVWQDFIFACSIYPMDEADFIENVRTEAEENIKRLRHRTSLALWCGNNEMEAGWENWGWAKHPLEDQLPELVEQFPVLRFLLDSVGPRELLPDWEVLKDAYDQFFHRTLPAWVQEFDPDTPYWPSSPSSGTPFQDADGQSRGDAHFWDVWHGRKPFTAYRDSYPRFMSEFGFQAFPTMETVEFYAEPAERNLTSYIMEHHQRGNHGNGLIIAQMTETFRMPENFAAWIYLSLILQAEGIRYGVEHWRRNMHRVAGTLYWQLNDCWPVASWASIDYFGRWKALHYASKRFYAPVLLSVDDQAPVMDIHISNDLPQPWAGTVKWSLETLAGEMVDCGNLNVIAPPLSDASILKLDFSQKVTPDNQRDLVFVSQLCQGNERLSLSTTLFVFVKHLNLGDPKIKYDMTMRNNSMVEIKLSPQFLAIFVEIKLEGAPDTVFSDNYFDIPAGQTVKVTFPIPTGWDLAKVKGALRVYSLYNSFT